MFSPLTILFFIIFLQVSINALVVGFTPPSSLPRLLALPPVVACVFYIIPICLPATRRAIWAALLGAHSLSFLLQYIDTPLLSKWSVETNGPSILLGSTQRSTGASQVVTPKAPSPWNRVCFGYHAAVSTRNVGTTFEVKGIPSFSYEDPYYMPSKRKFLSQKIILLLSCYLILDLLTFASQPEQNPILYQESRISWRHFENLSIEQLIIRSTSTLGFWVSLYCVIQFYMGTVAFACVALNLNDVKSWPPGFGAVGEAYNLRQFWG